MKKVKCLLDLTQATSIREVKLLPPKNAHQRHLIFKEYLAKKAQKLFDDA